MKLTININPEDILTVTHADDGRAVISMSIGNTVEMHMTVEEQADDVIDMLMEKDDKIEVGDEVEWDNDFTGDRFIVTRIYQPYGKKEQCDGIDDDGDVYRAVLIESLVKTGRHFDIASILEDTRND